MANGEIVDNGRAGSQVMDRRRWRVLLLSTKDEAPAIPNDRVELVKVAPLTMIPRFAEARRALAALSRYRLIAFCSAHAVDVVTAALLSTGQDARALFGIKLAAVGPATARRLAERNLSADLVASGEGGAALAREIIAAGFAGPVLAPRALGGRTELVDMLRAAGLEVEAVAAYETVTDAAAIAGALEGHQAAPFAAIAFTSPRGARAFLEIAGGGVALEGVLVGAIGETTARALGEAGLTPRCVTGGSMAALIDELCTTLEKMG